MSCSSFSGQVKSLEVEVAGPCILCFAKGGHPLNATHNSPLDFFYPATPGIALYDLVCELIILNMGQMLQIRKPHAGLGKRIGISVFGQYVSSILKLLRRTVAWRTPSVACAVG